MQRCMSEKLEGVYPTASSSVDDNSQCITPFSADPNNNAYNVRCKSHATAADALSAKAVAGWLDTNPCAESGGNLTDETLFIQPVSEWTDILDNFTRWNLPAKESCI